MEAFVEVLNDRERALKQGMMQELLTGRIRLMGLTDKENQHGRP